MIDIKKLFYFNHFDKKSHVIYSKGSPVWYYDPRAKEAFGVLTEGAKNMDKYYFTDSTMRRVDNMDLANIGCDELAHLYQPNGEKCGFIFCAKDKIHFAYIVMPSHIVLLCFKGEKLRNFSNLKYITLAEANEIQKQTLMNHILGSVIIPFYDKQCISLANDPCGRLLAGGQDATLHDRLWGYPEYRAEIRRLGKLIEGREKGSNHCRSVLKNMEDSYLDINEKMNLCLKMFIFLKTIKVIDKTFISEGNSRTDSTNKPSEFNWDYIKVDSFYSENISVLNPFSVKGHFRNQPKKNDKGEWYKELIYIDGFVKKGYNREATKSKLEKQNE